jgi:hypothetical protein
VKTWPDDVRRVKDAMDLHAVAGSYGFAVIALADGKPLDNTAYPSWKDAVKAAKWDRDNYMYLEIQPDGMSYEEAEAVLNYARTIHKLGYRIPSPDWDAGPLASSMPMHPRDRRRMARQLASGRPLYPHETPYSNLPQYRKAN